MKTLIIIPAYNEDKSIGKVLSDIKGVCDLDILVIDDGSTDLTAKAAKRHGSQVIRLSSNLGAWKATQTGIRYALLNGYSSVVTMDADGQHMANGVAVIMKELENGFDVVVGSCQKRVGSSKKLTWLFLRKLCGLQVIDITSGFRVYNRKALEVLSGPPATMLEYQDVGVLALLASEGCKIAETEVEMDKRYEDKSKIFGSYGAVCKYLLYSFILSIAKKR